MKSKKVVLSADLGGESGRVMEVGYNGKNLSLHELYRFPNIPVFVNGTLYWDILCLWNDVRTGIEKGNFSKPASIGVDTWGCDFVLLDEHDNLLDNPVHHRDSRTTGMMEKVFLRVPREEIFFQTGIQFMSINTLYQVMCLVEKQSSALSIANTILSPPDLLNFWLTGTKVFEFTSATTTQMFNPITNDWAWSLINKLEIPEKIFPEVVQPGTIIGKYKNVDVITVAAHDTGSAVAAVPAQSDNFVYISSGTWSLVGLEVDKPIINKNALSANVTNEGGVYGTFRLLKNVIGLWILQECRRTWEYQGKKLSYTDLMKMALLEKPLRSFIVPNDPAFLYPGNHPQLIQDICRNTSQPKPETPGAVVRCVLESLALAYCDVIKSLVGISGKKVDVVHIVGGGSKNRLLNQFTANAAGLPVIAGPAEATVIGNSIVQLITLGELDNLKDARQIISNMPELKNYEPEDESLWEEAYQRYKSIPVVDNKF
ncbi:MAG: rhamnulokinase family protein [Ignavibacteriaceae bacterium]